MNEQTQPKLRVARRWVTLAIVLVVALTAAGAWWFLVAARPSGLEQALPRTIEGLALNKVYSGDEAIRITARMHVGEVAPTRDAVIGYYRKDIRIWLARYDNPDAATQETARMAAAMRRFGRGFQQLERVRMDDSEVYVTFPGGEAQYFWTSRDVVAYIAAGPLTEAQVSKVVTTLDGRISQLPPVQRTE